MASEVMRKFMTMVERVARHVGTVLIVGETGTGKERIAHTIHEHSLRSSKPFVDINCAALPENLVESELFGYEKGRSAAPTPPSPGFSNWPTWEPFFWMKLENWISKYR